MRKNSYQKLYNNFFVRSFARLFYKINRLQFLSRYSIRRKILICFLLVSILPLLLSSFLQYLYLYSDHTKQTEQNFVEILSQADLNISNELDIVMRDNTLLVLNEDLIQALNFTETLDYPTLIDKVYQTESILSYLSDTFNTLYDSPKQIMLYVDWSTTEDFEAWFNTAHVSTVKQYKEWYGKDIDSACGWNGLHRFPPKLLLGNKQFISYISPIYNYAYEKLGYVEILVDIGHIIQKFNNVSLTPNSTIIFIDNQNQWFSEQVIDEAQIAQLQSLFEEQNSSTPRITRKDRYTRIVYPNTKSDYKLAALVPRSDWASLFLTSGWITLCILLGGILLSVILTLSISHSIYSPIMKLSTYMQNAHRSSYRKRPIIQQHNEIGMLYRSFNEMQDKINELLATVRASELELKKAELNLLQANINPHFLYNTLDTINWIAVLNHQDKIASITRALSDIFRYSLNEGKQIISIRDEVRLIQDYCYIQTIRMDKIKVSYDIDPQVLEYQTLKILLQPLVENSILHSKRAHSSDTIEIVISAQKSGDCIIFEVSDTGFGSDADTINQILKADSSKDGYGISNIDKRLKLYYGNEYGLSYSNYKEQGITATITIKAIRETQI